MEPIKKARKSELEASIQEKLMARLKAYDWLVMPTHGNSFQSGFPDLYCIHRLKGQRWIEVKNPRGYNFTQAQQIYFPQISALGVGIWILTGSDDEELNKLNLKPNWEEYYLRRMMHSKQPVPKMATLLDTF